MIIVSHMDAGIELLSHLWHFFLQIFREFNVHSIHLELWVAQVHTTETIIYLREREEEREKRIFSFMKFLPRRPIDYHTSIVIIDIEWDI